MQRNFYRNSRNSANQPMQNNEGKARPKQSETPHRAAGGTHWRSSSSAHNNESAVPYQSIVQRLCVDFQRSFASFYTVALKIYEFARHMCAIQPHVFVSVCMGVYDYIYKCTDLYVFMT